MPIFRRKSCHAGRQGRSSFGSERRFVAEFVGPLPNLSMPREILQPEPKRRCSPLRILGFVDKG